MIMIVDRLGNMKEGEVRNRLVAMVSQAGLEVMDMVAKLLDCYSRN